MVVIQGLNAKIHEHNEYWSKMISELIKIHKTLNFS